ncbi:MAG TPA: NB-ARC domain-containing protein, partial [Anaerolineae bacterium]|nr:NB-ARC domain-containing protein [Anaerolineae bacterium]
HNLPQPDYGRFVGREKEFAQVIRILRPYPHSQHALVTIDGIGGIGKSALALEVTHFYLRNFDRIPPEERFDAIIWTSAKRTVLSVEGIVQRRQALRTLDDIYTTIAVALQREDITRARPKEQSEVVRNALSQQRTLLIVDNLETVDDEAVLEFLRELPAPTKAIVTTRHRIDVAYPVRLVGLPREDAQELIAQESKKKDVTLNADESQRLYDRTGGVPLAVVWSIAQVGMGHGIELVLKRLSQPTGDIARFCFEGAIEYIQGKPAHQLLMALSLFATDASREALGYVTELPILDRDEGLVALEKLSLINKRGERFQALPLTLMYSQAELAQDVERERAYRERWIKFLSDMLQGRTQDRPLAFEAVQPEIENALAAMDWCWRTGRLPELGFFAEQLDPYLSRTGNLNSLIKYLRLAIEASLILEDEQLQAGASRRLANFLELQDDLGEAHELIDRAIAINRLHANKDELSRALYNLSAIQWKEHDYTSARASAWEAVALAQETGSQRNVIRNLCQLARIDLDDAQYDSAERLLHQALALRTSSTAPEQEEDWRVTMLYRLLGKVSFFKQDYASASQYYQQSLDIAQRLSVLTMVVRTLFCLAELDLARGESDRARAAAQKTLDLATKLGMKREAVDAQALLEQIGGIAH